MGLIRKKLGSGRFDLVVYYSVLWPGMSNNSEFSCAFEIDLSQYRLQTRTWLWNEISIFQNLNSTIASHQNSIARIDHSDNTNDSRQLSAVNFFVSNIWHNLFLEYNWNIKLNSCMGLCTGGITRLCPKSLDTTFHHWTSSSRMEFYSGDNR